MSRRQRLFRLKAWEVEHLWQRQGAVLLNTTAWRGAWTAGSGVEQQAHGRRRLPRSWPSPNLLVSFRAGRKTCVPTS